MVSEMLTYIRAVITRFLYICFGGIECVGHTFPYVAHFLFMGYVWIRTQSKQARDQLSHSSNMGLRRYSKYIHHSLCANLAVLHLCICP